MHENKSASKNIVIVPLEKRHIAEIREIEKECFSDPWTERMFLNILNNPLSVYYTALKVDDLSDKVVGYIGMYHIQTEGQIQNIAVTGKYRNQKIAQGLFDVLREYAIKNKIELFTLEVREKNIAALTLYKKLGFEKVGIRKNYYSNPTENAVLMDLYLE